MTVTATWRDVMKESILARVLRAHARDPSAIDPRGSTEDIHVHVPEGRPRRTAVGRRAMGRDRVGLTGSGAQGRRMTGEITLRGRVLRSAA